MWKSGRKMDVMLTSRGMCEFSVAAMRVGLREVDIFAHGRPPRACTGWSNLSPTMYDLIRITHHGCIVRWRTDKRSQGTHGLAPVPRGIPQMLHWVGDSREAQ